MSERQFNNVVKITSKLIPIIGRASLKVGKKVGTKLGTMGNNIEKEMKKQVLSNTKIQRQEDYLTMRRNYMIRNYGKL